MSLASAPAAVMSKVLVVTVFAALPNTSSTTEPRSTLTLSPSIFLPSALALYWVVGNAFMVGQTLLINKPMMKDSAGGAKK